MTDTLAQLRDAAVQCGFGTIFAVTIDIALAFLVFWLIKRYRADFFALAARHDDKEEQLRKQHAARERELSEAAQRVSDRQIAVMEEIARSLTQVAERLSALHEDVRDMQNKRRD